MRLLHTHQLKFQEFYDENLPEYAILSHRWIDDEELSHNEFAFLARDDGSGRTSVSTLTPCDISKKSCSGYSKVMKFRSLAHERYGCEWCWIDTVCIDKSSSAELSEAINCMFRWYQRSKICMAYLSDIGPSSDVAFSDSRWFTRGWTLQELLAPPQLSFWNVEWLYLGDKLSYQQCVSWTTRIPIPVLTGSTPISEVPIAKRISFAARRETSRREDRAYSLLGLLGVNMPLLYGEGNSAFRRLQENLIPITLSHALYVHDGAGFLAESVEDFQMLEAFDGTDQTNDRDPDDTSQNDSGNLRCCVAYLKIFKMLVDETWVRSITNRGVEVIAAYLEVETLPRLWIYRLIILSYPSMANADMPVFILVRGSLSDSRAFRIPYWHKVHLINGSVKRAIRATDSQSLAFADRVGAAIRSFRDCIEQAGHLDRIVKNELMFVR